jgi:hypothetical protein
MSNLLQQGVVMTNEQMKALANEGAAVVAAETIGLTDLEIKGATKRVQPEVKSGRQPGNYNPMPGGFDRPKYKIQHEG